MDRRAGHRDRGGVLARDAGIERQAADGAHTRGVAEREGLGEHDRVGGLALAEPVRRVQLEADRAAEGMAVAEILQTRAREQLAVDGIAVVGPAQRAADPEAAPKLLRLACQLGAGDIDIGAVEEVVVEIGDAVDMRAARLARAVLPLALIVGGEAEAADQAVAAAVGDQRRIGIGEGVEVDRGADESVKKLTSRLIPVAKLNCRLLVYFSPLLKETLGVRNI